ncbi:hypothetical protein ACB092_07G058100 [Castanea dentata]
MMQTDVAVEISEHVAQENQNQHQKYESESESVYWSEGYESSDYFEPNQVAQNGPKVYVHLMLYQAAKNGNWRVAKDILRIHQRTIRHSITESRESVLHIAFASKHIAFIKEVVRILTDEDLERTNIDGDTGLCFAAKLGIVTIAKEMVKKNNRLPLIRSSEGRTPLCIAVLFGHRDMASYLYTVTSFEGLSFNEYKEILVATITHDMYDIALYLLKTKETLLWYGNNKAEELNIKREIKAAALLELARKPFAIGSKSQLSLWKRCLNFWFKGNHEKSVVRALVYELVSSNSKMVKLFEAKKFTNIFVRNLLFDAVKFGNAEFINILIRTYPHIVWTTDDFHRSLFHIAVVNRQESAFNLLNEAFVVQGIILAYVDAYQRSILHLAGKLAPPSRLDLVPGAGLQMQRELSWFKEVEKMVPPSYLNMKDCNGKTAWEIFTDEHKDLHREGKEWMKDTANYCMIVATLITTVVFAAAFTVPGGSNQDTGTPILLKSIWFRVFVISDAVALFSSSSSILLFLSILTSRLMEMDFHVSLPSKLVWGLTALFISIVGMVVAFSATCFLVFNSEIKMTWLPIIIIASSCVPIIILFVLLHYHLWVDIIGSRFLFRRENRLSKWMTKFANWVDVCGCQSKSK